MSVVIRHAVHPAVRRLAGRAAAGAVCVAATVTTPSVTVVPVAAAAPAVPGVVVPGVVLPTDLAGTVARATDLVLRITTGERSREGDFPFPAYTAVVDPAATRLATERAHALAADPTAIRTGLATVNAVATGWGHQRELVGVGSVGNRVADPFEAELFGPAGDDPRFELMAGPKERTSVGVAPIPGDGRVVVVVVNGYPSEPKVGPYVAPASTTVAVPPVADPGPGLVEAIAGGSVGSS